MAGVAPTLLAARIDPADAVRHSSAALTQGGALRRAFAGMQVALCLALLVGAVLLLKTLSNLNHVDLGFDPDALSAVRITPREQGYDQARLPGYYRELLRRVQELPAVEAASLASSYPFAYPNDAFAMVPAFQAGADRNGPGVPAILYAASPQYFSTMRIPLVSGRAFSDDEFLKDRESARHVVVISQSLARRLFGNGPAVGQSIELFTPEILWQVVGVVGDTRSRSVERSELGMGREGEALYVPLQGRNMGGNALLVRSRGPHAETMATIRAIAAQIDPSIPLYDDITLNDAITHYISDHILFARLLSLLAALALILATVGLYGLVAYGVAARIREIGIRIALGAPRERVVGSVLREALTIGIGGVVIGFAAAFAVARMLRSRLYEVSPFDPATFVLAATILLAVALLAALLPARAATGVDPMVALRAE